MGKKSKTQHMHKRQQKKKKNQEIVKNIQTKQKPATCSLHLNCAPSAVDDKDFTVSCSSNQGNTWLFVPGFSLKSSLRGQLKANIFTPSWFLTCVWGGKIIFQARVIFKGCCVSIFTYTDHHCRTMHTCKMINYHWQLIPVWTGWGQDGSWKMLTHTFTICKA